MKRVSFCDGWEFSRNDGIFEPVVVPYDAMLGNDRGADAPAGSASGFYFGASYRYRKVFELGEGEIPESLMLEFEGVYRNPIIRVNGMELDAPPYGFVPFFVDISPAVHAGTNVVEVEASNADQPDCRWYSGGGLYRPVWLWSGSAARITPEGIRICTKAVNPSIIHVEVEATDGIPEVAIIDPEGIEVAHGMGRSLDFAIEHAQLWSAENPILYQCLVSLYVRGNVVDTAETMFGIRTLEWDTNGFRVNGAETLLRGGCIHNDNGILGAASYPASERRRVKLLKDAGFNALRIAHNPASAALLEACDELGMYVMDETWDTWFMYKSLYDYSHEFLDWCDHDLRRLVSRDYNHPSVIMYSIGNEIADAITPAGVNIERSLVDLLHALDPTRPVTCGFNLAMMLMEHMGRGWYLSGDGVASAAHKPDEAPRGSLLFNLAAQATGSSMTLIANAPGVDKLVSPALDALDIAGYNYASTRYAVDAKKHPSRIIVGTETFPFELASNWQKVKRYPTLIGDFMWAAWDYLGEAGAGAWAYTPEDAGFSKPWPWLIAGSGALDILGDPNAAAALTAAVWRTSEGPEIHVRPVNIMAGKTYKATWRGTDAIPSWSWRGCEGIRTQVEVYDGAAHSVALECAGRRIGHKRIHACVAKFDVEYTPGTLTAIAFDEGGRETGRSSLTSAEESLRIIARPEIESVAPGDVAYLSICIADASGCVESNADELLTVSVENGTLLGFGSARPATTERFYSGSYTTYRGRALAAVFRQTPGTVKVTVTGSTLPAATCVVTFE